MLLDFVSSLTQLWYIVPILMGVGAIFCIVEAIIPGFGFFGFSGIILFALGVVYYAIIEQDEPWKVLCVVAGVGLFFILVFRIIVVSSKKGGLSKTFVENKTALPVDYDLTGMMDSTKYLNKYGVLLTPCKPTGKLKINDDVIEVVSKAGLLEEGLIVKVVQIDDNKVFVEVENQK